MSNFLDKSGLTRFKEKLLDEVDSRISISSGGNAPTKEEILEGATRVTDVEVNPEITSIEALQTAVARVESNLGQLNNKLDNSTVHIIETWDDGTNWYRKWSDGRIDQGGRSTSNGMTVTFLVPFTRVVLEAHATANRNSSSAVGGNIYIIDLTTAKVFTDVTNGQGYWYVSGY